MNSINSLGSGKPKMVSLDAVIIRADGSREDLGTIAYWNRNPLLRLLYRIKRHFNSKSYNFLKGQK